jgi:hypothetical protein
MTANWTNNCYPTSISLAMAFGRGLGTSGLVQLHGYPHDRLGHGSNLSCLLDSLNH